MCVLTPPWPPENFRTMSERKDRCFGTGVRAAWSLPHCLVSASPAAAGTMSKNEMPDDFVYLRDVDPSIGQDMRYAGSDNFTGGPVPGYDAPECVLVRKAAEALKAVQADLKPMGLSLQGLRLLSPNAGRCRLRRLVERARRSRRQGGSLSESAEDRPVPRLYRHALGPFARRHARRHDRAASVDTCGGRPFKPEAAPQGDRTDDSLAMGTSFDCFDAKANTRHARAHRKGAGRTATCCSRSCAASGFKNYPQGMVALHVRAGALSGHLFRFSDLAAAQTARVIGRSE